jgi:hypothetical protein
MELESRAMRPNPRREDIIFKEVLRRNGKEKFL